MEGLMSMMFVYCMYALNILSIRHCHNATLVLEYKYDHDYHHKHAFEYEPFTEMVIITMWIILAKPMLNTNHRF